MVFASFLIVGSYFYLGLEYYRRARPMLWRMRWFFLSIFIIYFWMTPGEPIVGSLGDAWLPTWEGVVGGLQRVVVLVMLVLGVQLLILTTKRDQLISAIYWLSFPLGLMGISRERLAVRIFLVLESVAEVQVLAGEARARYSVQSSKVVGLAKSVADLISNVVFRAHDRRLVTVDLSLDDAPPSWQWSIPLVLFVSMVLINLLA